nr:SDR family NAD(P)-dependent oxidoreductase [Conexibacter sp. DBS9H8]
MSDEDWYKVLAVNLSGAFFMAQAVLPHMLQRGSGRIINISSLGGCRTKRPFRPTGLRQFGDGAELLVV